MPITVKVIIPYFGEIFAGELIERDSTHSTIKNSKGVIARYKNFQVFEDTESRIKAGKEWLNKNYHLRNTKQYQQAEKTLKALKERLF